MRRVTKIARASRLINGRKKKSISKSLKPPQTYDTRCPCIYVYSLKNHEVPEVNFYDKKKSSDYISFTDVFEFSSDLKKNEWFQDYIGFTDVFEFFFESSSKWRFYVIFRIVKKALGFIGKLRTSRDEVEK